MQFAQEFEVNLRAFLYTMDYHGWGDEIPLTEKEKERFKTVDRFIDEATCGSLIKALRATGAIKTKSAGQQFDRACKHRNRLAHSFLADHEFHSEMTQDDLQSVLRELHAMTADLYAALVISDSIRDQVEEKSDQREQWLIKFTEELGFRSGDHIKRKYVSPSKRKK